MEYCNIKAASSMLDFNNFNFYVLMKKLVNCNSLTK